jgi:hypothetical protein
MGVEYPVFVFKTRFLCSQMWMRVESAGNEPEATDLICL